MKHSLNETINKLNIMVLSMTNYFIWSLKIKAALILKRLHSVISEVKAEGLSEKGSVEWNKKKQ